KRQPARQDFVADAAQLARGLTLGGLGSTAAQWSSGASGIADSREQGLRGNVRYTAPFGLTLGLMVEQLDYYARYNTLTVGDITSLQKRAARVEFVYQIGSHTIGGAYHRALPIVATLAAPNVFNAEGTAGQGVTAAYAFKLSKGLAVTAYFMTIVNAANARYNVVFQGLPSPAGADLRAFGTGMRYAF
ncbi:MAG: hypothetical protein H7X95_04110, partial [Deltaproteobacteria bacterium]|nr:hypothetical protein [Deltaproteobacteria bacterium]